MKKLLSILGSLGLVATGSLSVISCGTKDVSQKVKDFVNIVNSTLPSTDTDQGSTAIIAIGAKNNRETQYFKKSIALYQGQEIKDYSWSGIDDAYQAAQKKINNSPDIDKWVVDSGDAGINKSDIVSSLEIQNEAIIDENNDKNLSVFNTGNITTSSDQITTTNGVDYDYSVDAEQEGNGLFGFKKSVESSEGANNTLSLNLFEFDDASKISSDDLISFISNTFLVNSFVKSYLNKKENWDFALENTTFTKKESEKDKVKQLIDYAKGEFTDLESVQTAIKSGANVFLTIRNGQLIRISKGFNSIDTEDRDVNNFISNPTNGDDIKSKKNVNTWIKNEILNNSIPQDLANIQSMSYYYNQAPSAAFESIFITSSGNQNTSSDWDYEDWGTVSSSLTYKYNLNKY